MTEQAFDKANGSEKNCNGVQLSLLLPAHNEGSSIEHTISELYHEIGSNAISEIVVREGGSTDCTKSVLLKLSQTMPLKPIMSDQKGGYKKDVQDGLKRVKTEYVLFIDSDGQYVPSDFWKLRGHMNNYDMVIGRKIKRADPPHRIIMSKVFHGIIRILFGLPVHDPDCGYRIIKKSVIDDVLNEVRFLEYSFWSEFTVRAFKKGFKLHEVPILHRKRFSGGTRVYMPTQLLRIMILQFVGLFWLWNELRKP